MEQELKAEVEALSTAQHKKILTLQGYCLHDGYRLLIYKYMENYYWLHERADGPSGLNWPARLKIMRGAIKGVAYMHETCEPHIVHRDLKSSNILLDRDFERQECGLWVGSRMWGPGPRVAINVNTEIVILQLQ
ncbi:Tyrosine-sulfated glycopeptide receptor 1 [Castilleja foliolosa]|uniref:non-specific serine/threonine protein kinase n=1 Tax=Castilleja foliolosa TaxID=1961234 RepID=A0ABD3CU31_9LAMI